MLWLTWRQHRVPVLVTFGFLALLGLLMLINGLGAADLPRTGASGPEMMLDMTAQRQAEPLRSVLEFLILVPALIGLFWGAPLLGREFDRKTQLLAWTQSVSRGRWLAMKLATLGTLVVVAGLIMGTMTSLWLDSYAGTQVDTRFSQVAPFTMSGIAPAGWWLFAFAVGVASGALLRRTMPAIALTLAVFVIALIGVVGFARDYYAPPLQDDGQGNADTLSGDVRSVGRTTIAPDGRELDAADARYEQASVCPGKDQSLAGLECMKALGYREIALYHPADRYWRFQWTEAGALSVLAVGLGGFAVRRTVRQRP